MTATALLPDGSRRVERSETPTLQSADCFYIYPTVSLSPGLSAAPAVTEAERRAVRQQAQRLTAVCRLFVPFYRQVTVTSMKPGFLRPTPDMGRAARNLAEADVLAAWDHYVARENKGRPIVLIGHSQGANLAIRLIQQRIDGKPIERQLVSAILPGAFVLTPTGANVGGTFKTIPPCRTETQAGCVIAFNSVRADRKLPETMKPNFPGQELVCTNPASLRGGSGVLKPYFSTVGETIIPDFTAPQGPWTRNEAAITTPFVTTPGLYSAECRTDEHGSLLAVSTHLAASDARTGNLAGDWVVGGVTEPTMGLHLLDLNLVAGNLVDVLRQQIESVHAHLAR